MKQGPQTYGFTVATCGTKAAKLGMKYFALQHDGWCVTDNDFQTPADTYTKKLDSDCGNACSSETSSVDVKKCGSAWTNAIYETGKQEIVVQDPTWIGCYVDDAQRDMKQGPQKYGYTVDSCGLVAKGLGMKYFALQHNGWCVTDNDYQTPPYSYEKKPDSECGSACSSETSNVDVKRCGGSWRNAIYET